jgi:arginyl-tRNA synthetase
LRYQCLNVRIGGDVIFDVSEAVSLQGNSGPYLQYAHARARSILVKSQGAETPKTAEPHKTGVEILDAELPSDNNQPVFQPAERNLARKISEYSEVVDLAIIELLPHHICTYLFELAQEFNRFYEQNRVVGDDRQTQRLQLVQTYADTLKHGLDLLGITAPDRM